MNGFSPFYYGMMLMLSVFVPYAVFFKPEIMARTDPEMALVWLSFCLFTMTVTAAIEEYLRHKAEKEQIEEFIES